MAVPEKKGSLTVTVLTKQFTCIGDSGNEVRGVFCPESPVRIYRALKSVPDILSIKSDTLDDTSGLRPVQFIWMKSARG
ncbi:GFA family protein [Caballeronia sp. SEWSISQ10-4 2]|uniref:GFA family protein n=1 Tax=Caballeronia sp. SEWSISQ10-4 2 TaxID=2937438 RepID=UPI0034618B30